jgi:hypothetical protein
MWIAGLEKTDVLPGPDTRSCRSQLLQHIHSTAATAHACFGMECSGTAEARALS